jgi:hypothetical protein
MLKNMQPACMFMGSSVHKTIEWALKTHEKSKQLPPESNLIDYIQKLIIKSIEDSSLKRWKIHPKHHMNLLEHYYNASFGKDDADQLQEKAISCIKNWYISPLVQQVILSPRASWLGIEAMQTFTLEKDIEAIVVYDFYLNWSKSDKTNTMLIFDWKTGQENKKIEDQLFAYALAAKKLFSVSPEALILSPFYLNAGPSGYKKYGAGQEKTIDEAILQATQERIIASAKQMLSVHPQKNEQGIYPPPDPTLFPYPDDKRGCRRCQFQELCQASRFQEKSYEELRCLVSSLPLS